MLPFTGYPPRVGRGTRHYDLDQLASRALVPLVTVYGLGEIDYIGKDQRNGSNRCSWLCIPILIRMLPNIFFMCKAYAQPLCHTIAAQHVLSNIAIHPVDFTPIPRGSMTLPTVTLQLQGLGVELIPSPFRTIPILKAQDIGTYLHY